MKKLLIGAISIFLFLIISCKKSDNPVNSPNTPQVKTIALSNYFLYIDSTYYKMWSDSSWEKFNGTANISGKAYVKVINSDGNEYYYSTLGYAGFKPSGESLILFDKEFTSLPDTLEFGKTYNLSATFYYQGYNYTMQAEETFSDTVNVAIPLGIFNPCLWFKIKTTISAGGQSQSENSQSWIAPLISTVKQTLNSGQTIVLLKGTVNGRGWGMSFPKDESLSKYNRAGIYFKEVIAPILNNPILIK